MVSQQTGYRKLKQLGLQKAQPAQLSKLGYSNDRVPGISKCFDVNMLDEIPNRSNEEVDSVLGQKEKHVLCMYMCLAAEETEKTLHAEWGRELWATANIYLYKNFSPHCFRETKLD